MKTLLLTGKEVKGLLNMPDAILAVEQGYKAYNQNMVEQPPIVSIDITEYNGEMDIKAGYSKATEMIAVKTAVGYWDNPKRYQLPTGLAVITLYDAKNGYPICIMDGSLITGYRTGAAGGVSAKILARENSESVGVIGAGSQARMQVMAINEVLPVKTVKVWSPVEEEQIKYKKDMESLLNISVTPCSQAEEAVSDSDIVVTATPAKALIVRSRWIRPGTHIIAIGADMEGKQELDPKIFSLAKVVVDSKSQCIARGETQNPVKAGILAPEDIYAEIGEILSGTKSGRENQEEVTLFDSTGMSIQDNMTACKIYEKAVISGAGNYIQLI